MKFDSLHKIILVLLLLVGSMYAYASDTLKVKKVKFFIESKVVFDIPINKTTTSFGYDCDCGVIPSHGGYTEEKNISQNKTVFNVGLSAGLSVKLSKHFFYELSISYYHYNVSSKQTTTNTYLSGYPETDVSTYSYQASYNNIGLGNGISYRYKKIRFTNTLLLYQYINYKEKSVYGEQDNYGSLKQAYVSSGNVIKDGCDIVLMSEHKIGYSFLNNRIVPCIGVNFNWTSSFDNIKSGPQYKCVWLPFASVKINF